MQLYSTNNSNLRVSFEEAIFKGLPSDNGLFMPLEIPKLPASFFEHLHEYSLQDIAYQVASHLVSEDIPAHDLQDLICSALDFPAPLVQINQDTCILELFHGPSLAFKDFGARFMAATMSYFNRKNKRNLVILVATSGDTGGAVAAGFYKTPGIEVVILYPSGKVSPLQEKQLTTLGHNISALEINGSFDDCQALVKQAFLDDDINEYIRLSSANSINIARLIPQSFYYFEAYKQAQRFGKDIVFIIPSGNFGNLTAGLFAKRMGLPVAHFIAATNANDVVPEYLHTGNYQPRPSVRTLSNAMDVGSPSNFARMLDLYGSTWNIMKEEISGYGYNDEQTREMMRKTRKDCGYILDPHAAVGVLAWKEWKQNNPNHASIGIVLETAHPAKFLEDVEGILQERLEIPERLAVMANQEKVATSMDPDYDTMKTWLLERFGPK